MYTNDAVEVHRDIYRYHNLRGFATQKRNTRNYDFGKGKVIEGQQVLHQYREGIIVPL